MFAHAGRGNSHFLGLHRQNETYMKKSTLFETAKKSSVRQFWSYFLALHGQTYIELFVQPFTFLMFFDVFV